MSVNPYSYYKPKYYSVVFQYRCQFCCRFCVAPDGRAYTDNEYEKYRYFCKVCIEKKRRRALAKLQQNNWKKYYYNRNRK